MIINYFLRELNQDDLSYRYNIEVYNDILTIDIHFNNYPDYMFIDDSFNNYNFYYKIVKIYNQNNQNENKNNLGDIKLINISKYVKNRLATKEIILDNCLYKKCSQTDVDRYYYLNNIKNDNSKLFEYIYKNVILYYKNLHLEHKKNIKTFIVNNKIYKESII